MSIVRTFNGATILKPGAYTKIVVENLTGFPLAATGVVGIIGEAKGGRPGVLDILSKDNIQAAKARYKSGPIADALELLVNPTKDPRIANGAGKIVIYKTNASTQSQANLVSNNGTPVAMLALKSKNYGADENNLSASVAQGSIVDSQAVILGSISGPFNLAGGETLIVRVNGSVYTYTNTLVGAAVTAAALMADINTTGNWAPSKPVTASLNAQRINLTVSTGAVGEASSVAVDAASTIDTIVGLIGSARGARGSRILTFKKDLVTEQMLEAGGVDQMSVRYVGAATGCQLSIQRVSGKLMLTTSCVSTPADDLSVELSTATGGSTLTLTQLVDLLNSFGGGSKYQAVLQGPTPTLNVAQFDYYLNIEIKDVALSLRKDMQAIVDVISLTSSLVEASRIDNIEDALAVTSSPVFLAGAVDGVSANSDFVAGFEAFKEERLSIIVPLISKDEGALTIDSINSLAASHAAWGWSTTGRSERHAFVSKLGTKDQVKAAARVVNSGYVSLVAQSTTVPNRAGDLVNLEPWSFACICAGLRAGAEVGEPLTSKFINVNNLFVADGSWNPRKDYNEMIDAGVLIGEPMDSGGFRVVLGNTTYGIDPSFVWNRESVVQASGYVAYDLRVNLDLTFTGTKAKTGSAEAIANFIKARMTAYLEADIIVGDDDNEGLGYKKLSVQINGNTAAISISITPVQGIDFILPTIYLADIRQSA